MTSIYQVRDNLLRTIENKEAYLSKVNRELVAATDRADIMALDTTAKFLHININELKLILKDVTECCTIATEQSWLGVDRQGGI